MIRWKQGRARQGLVHGIPEISAHSTVAAFLA
jgi:hypothetical protein